jgi:hypothetical protein
LGRGDTDKPGTLLHEGDASGGTGAAEDRKGHPDRPAPASHHETPFCIAVDGIKSNIVPIDLELVGQDAGKRRAHMLAHLGADDVDGDDPVAVDAIPDGGLKCGLHRRRRIARREARLRKAEGQARAGRANQEAAAR